MRQKYIAGNWKMHKTIQEARDLSSALAVELKDSSHKIMVAPPFTALSAVADSLANSDIIVAAQNMSNVEITNNLENKNQGGKFNVESEWDFSKRRLEERLNKLV